MVNSQVITLDQWIAEFFNNLVTVNGWSYGNLILSLISIILCVILCGAIGLEREKRGRSAGLRTHLLVGVGSCIIMIISIYGFPTTEGRDIARLAAQVIAGVGFLGAGTIIHNNGGIKGLTTASTVWLVMAIGLACGSMNFVLAIASTLVVMIVLVSFRRLERFVFRTHPLFVVLSDASSPVMSDVLKLANEFGYSLSDITSQMINSANENLVELTFKVGGENGKEVSTSDFSLALQKTPGIKSVQVLNHH